MQKQMRMQHGADPVYVAQVQEKEVDFRTHMQKIKSAGVDGIMVAALAETMLEMGRRARAAAALQARHQDALAQFSSP